MCAAAADFFFSFWVSPAAIWGDDRPDCGKAACRLSIWSLSRSVGRTFGWTVAAAAATRPLFSTFPRGFAWALSHHVLWRRRPGKMGEQLSPAIVISPSSDVWARVSEIEFSLSARCRCTSDFVLGLLWIPPACHVTLFYLGTVLRHFALVLVSLCYMLHETRWRVRKAMWSLGAASLFVQNLKQFWQCADLEKKQMLLLGFKKY